MRCSTDVATRSTGNAVPSASIRGRFQWLPQLVISGGQTGVDRAALDWAISHGIAHGGWCPKGRLAADGPLPPHYRLRETESAGYRQRTKLNVQQSDATLIFNIGELDGGTLNTVRFITDMKKPHLGFQLVQSGIEDVAQLVVEWLKQGRFTTLNIAGPREEKRPGIYNLGMSVLNACLMQDLLESTGLPGEGLTAKRVDGLKIAPSAFRQQVTDWPRKLDWDGWD